jgi:polysaccharide chain length determinant protein (PEP-CTERM system associated)
LISSNAEGLIEQGRNQIEEVVALVTSTLHGMWRFRWIALLAAWGISLAGWITVLGLPDVYQASTRFYVDAESMIRRVVGDLAITENMMADINVLTRAMLSRPQLEKTARSAGLDLTAVTAEDKERLISSLSSSVALSREGGENVFRISYQGSDRNMVETVVKTLLDGLMEDAHGERRTDSGAASDFLDGQIADYTERLDEAEQRLADFKRENIGLMPGESGDYYTRLQRSMVDVEKTRAQLRLVEARRDEYQKQLAGEQPVFGFASASRPVAASGTAALIEQYEEELSTLLLRYTENHPNAVALRETIDRLRSQALAEGGGAPPIALGPGGEPLEANPVYQRMRMGLSESEAEIASLRTSLMAQEVEVTRLQALVDTIPDIERRLTALNRDYDVTREQYDVLLERRESLRLTGQVEETGEQLQFRIIDPPRASLTPVGPDRPLYLAGTTLLAVGIALALAFLLHQLNPVFAGRRELRAVTGLPVLGSVSLARRPSDRRSSHRRRLIFAVASAALPAAFGLAVLLHERGHQFVARLLSAVGS